MENGWQIINCPFVIHISHISILIRIDIASDKILNLWTLLGGLSYLCQIWQNMLGFVWEIQEKYLKIALCNR